MNFFADTVRSFRFLFHYPLTIAGIFYIIIRCRRVLRCGSFHRRFVLCSYSDAIFPCRGDTPQWGRQPFRSAQTLFSISLKNPARGRIEARRSRRCPRAVRLYEGERILFPLAHAPYIYNPATADERIREYTLSMMKSELEFLESIPGSLYNFHPGAHVKAGSEVGCRLTAECLNTLLTEDMATTVLIETMSGRERKSALRLRRYARS